MKFERKAYRRLLDWKNDPGRKPLIIRGARQVGKSTLVQQFAKEFRHFIPLNMEKQTHKRFFETLQDVRQITDAVFLSTNTPKGEGPVLLFIDEIQESPRAIQLLRYFYEEQPDLYVVAAGSLLEFALRDVPSFPVGRVEQMVLHPFDFEEFLMALGHTAAVEALNQIPVEPHAHETLLALFHVYAAIGGMPEIVSRYVSEQSMANLLYTYESIWQGYKDDVVKYARNATERKVMQHIIYTAPQEKDRVVFEGFGHSNYRSREVGEALRALDQARILQLIYPSSSTRPPLEMDYKKRPRLQFLDTGLLNHAMQLQADMIGLEDLNNLYNGRIVQHLVTQELMAQYDMPSYKPCFWVRENASSQAEVDLLYVHTKYVIPVEVKSGESGTLRSLHQFMEACNHPYAIRLLANRFSVDRLQTTKGTPYLLMNLPYYLGTKIPAYASYFTATYAI
ncbi:MAG: ATP-binding protein [Saprospiraceae bacterium]|nr:ATP-binding protein [Saprospiraceae bacterium]